MKFSLLQYPNDDEYTTAEKNVLEFSKVSCDVVPELVLELAVWSTNAALLKSFDVSIFLNVYVAMVINVSFDLKLPNWLEQFIILLYLIHCELDK